MGTGHATWAGHGGLRSGIGAARIVRLARVHGNASRAAELHRAVDAPLRAELLHEPLRHIPPLGGILHRHVFHGKPSLLSLGAGFVRHARKPFVIANTMAQEGR